MAPPVEVVAGALAGVERVFVGLGANLGDTAAALDRATRALSAAPGLRLIAVSPRYRSAPIEATGPDFVNAAAELRSALAPAELLALLHRIEAEAGRERPYPNAPRVLDLDLLLFGERAIEPTPEAPLAIPHPRLHQRAFVLRPLLDLDPDLAHPRLGRLDDWLRALGNQRLERIV